MKDVLAPLRHYVLLCIAAFAIRSSLGRRSDLIAGLGDDSDSFFAMMDDMSTSFIGIDGLEAFVAANDGALESHRNLHRNLSDGKTSSYRASNATNGSNGEDDLAKLALAEVSSTLTGAAAAVLSISAPRKSEIYSTLIICALILTIIVGIVWQIVDLSNPCRPRGNSGQVNSGQSKSARRNSLSAPDASSRQRSTSRSPRSSLTISEGNRRESPQRSSSKSWKDLPVTARGRGRLRSVDDMKEGGLDMKQGGLDMGEGIRGSQAVEASSSGESGEKSLSSYKERRLSRAHRSDSKRSSSSNSLEAGAPSLPFEGSKR